MIHSLANNLQPAAYDACVGMEILVWQSNGFSARISGGFRKPHFADGADKITG